MTMITPSSNTTHYRESLHACRSTLEDLLVIWIFSPQSLCSRCYPRSDASDKWNAMWAVKSGL